MDIAAWLHSLGMRQYEQAFRDNAVDAAVLPELTAEERAQMRKIMYNQRAIPAPA